MQKHLLFFLLFFGMVFALSAQQPTKEELTKKQQELQKEIADLNNTLKKIQQNKKQSLSQLSIVTRKLRAREELVNAINKDIRLLEDNIYLGQLEINRLKRELDTLKMQYAQSIVFAYKNRSSYEYLNFLFSATSFNDAIKRMSYLKSYRQYRETQSTHILQTQQMIEGKIAALNGSKQEKNVVLQEQSKQLKVLEDDKKEKDQIVAKLKSQESDLAKEIRNREKQRQQLQAALTAIIKREIDEAKKREAAALAKKKAEEAKNASATTANSSNNTINSTVKPTEVSTGTVSIASSERTYSPFESTEEGLNQSINFETNKGKLPWPVDAGYVAIHFGSYEIPNTKLKGISDGIEIALPTGANVKSVADGEVTAIFDLGGEQSVVVRHGKYFTTYSHLASVNVTKDQKVKAGTIIGKAAADDSGGGSILFMVSTDKGSHMNPEQWLKRR